MMFVLVDCNNFFVSCELVFHPHLKGRPVVVLSNNDGCIVARSKEAKQMGIPMGAPIFQYKELVEAKKLITFSSNFSLYGDMSQRVMRILEESGFPMEIYSIDEAFLKIPYPDEKMAYELKEKIYQQTGIPVSLGIAPTKTLAKLASEIAKKGKGVHLLSKEKEIEAILKITPPEDIWGIGAKSAKELRRHGLYTALDLQKAPKDLLLKHLGIMGIRTHLELGGTPCFTLQTSPPNAKSILVSRSFKTPLVTLEDLSRAISQFVAQGSRKLRRRKANCSHMQVFIATSRFHKELYFSDSCQIILPLPTSYTPTLISYALKAVEKMYQKGLLYKRAGIYLSDFSYGEREQDFFEEEKNTQKEQGIMEVVDKINARYGKKTIFFASEGVEKKIPVSSGKSSCNKSYNYTTKWEEILTINI